jgi:hypothetical protein
MIGLGLSPVSAAAAIAPSGNPSGIHEGNPGSHPMFNSTGQAARVQAVLANLSEQGVDISPAQAYLTAGNVTAASQWLMSYYKANPGFVLNGARQPAFDRTMQHGGNSTREAVMVRTAITKLGGQGIDVTKALSDLATGNISAAMQDLMLIHKDDPGLAPGLPGRHAFNSTQITTGLQTRVTKLAGQGVDVSQVQSDIDSGNVSAAMQWMAAYQKIHPVQIGNGTASHDGNITRWQNGGAFRPNHAGFGNQTLSHVRPPVPVQGA